MKFEFNKHFIENNDESFKIELKPGVDIPRFLYKYYYLNNFSVDVVKNETFHFSHSFTMNDLMDGNFLLWDMETFITKYINDKKLPKNLPEYAKLELHKNMLLKFSDEFLKYIGVFCLCDNYSNDLFWTHYTNESGYCVEINTEKLIESIKEFTHYIFPIQYEKLKQINVLDYSILKKQDLTYTMDVKVPIFYSLAVKDQFWNYENEWRFIIKNEKFDSISNPQSLISDEQKKIEKELAKNRNIKISNSAFEKIILGTLFFNNKRFSHKEAKGYVFKYYFIQNKEKENENLKEFLSIIYNKFPDKIFQIDKYIKNGEIIRDIQYKINILEITDDFIEIERM